MTGTIARSGYTAERLLGPKNFRKYFSKEIDRVQILNKLKVKTDLVIYFHDGTSSNIQTKNGLNTRGHAVDRRKFSYFEDSTLKREIESVCLLGCPEGRGSVDISRRDVVVYLRDAFVGQDEVYRPEWMVHTVDGDIRSMTRMDEFFDRVVEGLYEKPVSKRTCIWLSDSLYIQRKGSRRDRRSDDLQLKWRYRYH